MTLHELLHLPGGTASTGSARGTWDAAGPPAPPGADCDAAIATLVTGHLDPAALTTTATGTGTGTTGIGAPGTTAMAARTAAQLELARAIQLLSGRGGPAAWLRTTRLPRIAAAPSHPLDIGTTTETIPPWLRRAIITRDQHCTFPGCYQPPSACHVHHLVPRSEGGTTSLQNCRLFCTFHHLIAIHRWGWQITIDPDGTTTATSPRGDRVLRSHAPPAAA